MRRNPKVGENPAEVIRVVENEWLSLTVEQRSIYENIAKDTSLAASRFERN
jgi:hypothetical protein